MCCTRARVAYHQDERNLERLVVVGPLPDAHRAVVAGRDESVAGAVVEQALHGVPARTHHAETGPQTCVVYLVALPRIVLKNEISVEVCKPTPRPIV